MLAGLTPPFQPDLVAGNPALFGNRRQADRFRDQAAAVSLRQLDNRKCASRFDQITFLHSQPGDHPGPERKYLGNRRD